MIKIVTVIGARPQIIKAAAISRAIKNHYSNSIKEVIVHTGQHYDENMSRIFFNELGIPEPDYNLNTGGGTHGKQTAAMITGIEEILLNEKPTGIVLYGDTNSTLAGAIAASKLHVPVIHIEAGLRSFNKAMPEEVNRIMCDHVSTLLFSPTKAGYINLQNEGFKINNAKPYSANNPKTYHSGDVMYDNSLFFSGIAEEKSDILIKHGLTQNKFILATIHRNNNTDDPARLNTLFKTLHQISGEHAMDVILPMHPRTAKLLQHNLNTELYELITTNNRIKLIEPVSFLEMIVLEKNCAIVMTDSGGVQKEAFYFKKPCVILRAETEWVELVECGSAILADADEEKILSAFSILTSNKNLSYPNFYGNGKAAEFICEEMFENL